MSPPAPQDPNGPRILAFFCNFPPEGGAASSRNSGILESFVARFRPQRVDVVYFDLVHDLQDRYIISNEGPVTVTRIGRLNWFFPWGAFPWFNPFSAFYFLAFGVPKLLTTKPDIVVLAVPPYPMAPLAIAARLLGVRGVVVDAHDALGRNIFFAAKTRGLGWTILAPFADMLVRFGAVAALLTATVVSSVYAKDPVTDLTISHLGARWTFAPNGVDFDLIERIRSEISRSAAPDGASAGSTAFVHAGGLQGYYQPERVVPVLRNVATPARPISLLLVGSGSLRIEKGKMPTASGSFHLLQTGTLPHPETIQRMIQSDFGIYSISPEFPDQSRALGVKALEYLACGLPLLVIAPANNPVARLVLDNGLGRCADPDRLDEIESAVRTLLDREAEYKNAVRGFVDQLRSEFDMKRNLARISEALAEQLKTIPE